jgi:hypothetical protein
MTRPWRDPGTQIWGDLLLKHVGRGRARSKAGYRRTQEPKYVTGPKSASRRVSALLLSDHEVRPSLANALLGTTPLEDSAPQASSHAGTR